MGAFENHTDNRIEVINELKLLEGRKLKFESLEKDVKDWYCKKISIVAYTETKAFEEHYDEEEIEVDKDLFVDYIKREINTLEVKIQELIDQLK